MSDLQDLTPRDLSLMLAEDIEAVCAALHIDVRRRDRRKLYAFAPWGDGKKPKLEIELYPVPGKWNDWIGGKWGDALDLVACTLSGGERTREARIEAMKWARRHFGLTSADVDHAALQRRRKELEQRNKERAARAARELAEARRTAQARWLAAFPLTFEDAGGQYLLARGIDLRQLGRAPRAIRFAPAERWYDGEGRVGHVGPCLLSAMTLPDGKFGALHRIWINPERPGEKADLSPPRKMWPDASGAVIRLWRGASNLSEKAAAERGVKETVVACEGVEDGLSIALMTPELRVSAAGSLPGLLAMTPPATCEQLVIAADNDWGKPQAQALLDRACARFVRDFGVRVKIARSPEGKDFNDLLRGGGE